MNRALFALVLVACGQSAAPTTLTLAIEGAASAEIFVFAQRTRSGEAVDCRSLLSGVLSVGDPDLVVLAGPVLSTDPSHARIDGLAPGAENRVVFVNVFDGADGLGRIVGRGCKASVTVSPGQRREEVIELD